MSPEQARGKPVDKRADIWAFGVVLFEMLTGRRAFEGDDIAITLAAVMMKEPDWRALPAATPAALRRLLTRCLKKDPKARMRDIGDARLQIEELLSGAPEEVGVTCHPACAVTLAARAAVGGRRRARYRIDADRHGGHRPAPRRRVPPAAGPVRVHDRAAREHVVWRSSSGGGTGVATQVAVSPDGRNIVVRRRRPARLPDLAATGRQPWPRGRFREPKAGRSRSGRRTAGSSGSSRAGKLKKVADRRRTPDRAV